MLALVREHARPSSSTTWTRTSRAAHAAYVADFVEDLFARRWTDTAGTWLDDVSARCSPRCASPTTGRGSVGTWTLTARIVAALGGYWFLEGHHAEGQRWVSEMLVLEGDTPEPAVVSRLHLAAGLLAFLTSQPGARGHRERAVGAVPSPGRDPAPGVHPRRRLGDVPGRARPVRRRDADQRRGARARPAASVRPGAVIAQVLNVRGGEPLPASQARTTFSARRTTRAC